jgi:ComF family protein
VPWLGEPLCALCGRVSEKAVRRCAYCQEMEIPLKQIRAAALYAGPMVRLIQQMKYEGFFALTGPVAQLMAEAWPRWHVAVDLVLPIPLHPRRERERGYNQSALLVEQLCRRLGWTADFELLRRIRRTRPQVGLTVAERRANVAAAFAVVEPGRVAGRDLLLVDDVCTTGATMAAAASALLQAGAHSVSGYTAARAIGTLDHLTI